MGDVILKLKTENSLLEALKKASEERPNPNELLEQRVSFIFGSLKVESSITHDRIKKILVEQQEGGAVQA